MAAGIGARIVAGIIDLFLVLAPAQLLVAIVVGLRLADSVLAAAIVGWSVGGCAFIANVVFMIRTGQTFGRSLRRIQIVTHDTKPVTWVHVIVGRTVVPAALLVIGWSVHPWLGGGLLFANLVAPMFASSRSLIDRISRTRAVRASPRKMRVQP